MVSKKGNEKKEKKTKIKDAFDTMSCNGCKETKCSLLQITTLRRGSKE
jgi:hypothetical protein